MKIFVIFFAFCALVKCNVLERTKIFQEINCNIQDPDLDKCVLYGARKSLPRWLKGIPELGIPPMDPLYIPKLTVNQIISDFVNMTATFTNLQVMGFKNTVINAVKVDPQNLYGSIKISIPWLNIQTDFSLNGNIGPMPIENRAGHFEGNFTDIFFFMKASVKPYKKDDGLEYFKINKLHQEITIVDGQIKLDAKDKQYQPAVEMMSSYFNQNAGRMLETASPIISKTSERMTKKLLDNVLSTIPTSEIM